MLTVLGDIGDYLMIHVPRPVALLLRLPVLVFVGYFLLWTTARGGLRVAAVSLSPIARVVAHVLWYLLLMPEAWLSMRAVKQGKIPAPVLYLYGEQVEHLALATRSGLRYLARMLASASRASKAVLFWLGFVWGTLALVVG